MFILPAFVFCVLLTCGLVYMILKKTASDDRHYILRIIVAALISRLVVLLIVQYYCFSRGLLDIFGDAADNLLRGYMFGDYLSGRIAYLPKLTIYKFGTYNTHIITFFNSIFFAFFRDDVFSLKYINILCMILIGWLTYDLAKEIYNSNAGKISLCIVLFWPTLFAWSITDLKEVHLALATTGMLWSVDKVISKRDLKYRIFFLVLTIIFFIYFTGLRLSFLPTLLFYFIIVSIYFTFRWCIRKSSYKGIITFFLLLILCCILFLFKEKLYQIARSMYATVVSLNVGYLSSGGINYNLISNVRDIYNVKFFIKFFFGSWFHFLLEPFVWKFTSLKMFSLYPIMFLWYFLLCSAIAGVIKVCKIGRIDRVFSPSLFLVLYITSLCMAISNIGTAIRHRDVIVPVIAMLASFGIASIPKTKDKFNY